MNQLKAKRSFKQWLMRRSIGKGGLKVVLPPSKISSTFAHQIIWIWVFLTWKLIAGMDWYQRGTIFFLYASGKSPKKMLRVIKKVHMKTNKESTYWPLSLFRSLAYFFLTFAGKIHIQIKSLPNKVTWWYHYINTSS